MTIAETEQQRQYEVAYLAADSEYGFPDPKIADSQDLRDKRILVVGCGTGSDVWHLTEENEVIGLDYANSGLQIAERHGIHVETADLNEFPSLPFNDAFFDIIVLKDILEHILDPLAVLKDARRVLKDDGYIVISVPNQFYFPMRFRIALGQGLIHSSLFETHRQAYDEWNYMHIRFFTYAGFRRFLKEAALSPEKWFWDFGNLAHYHQPEMWLGPQLWKKKRNMLLSTKAKIGLYVIRPAWAIFNFILPRVSRRFIVSLAPGVLCGGFYVRCRKQRGEVNR